jgi:5-formyltetrahydrofolate cyclo-ligase
MDSKKDIRKQILEKRNQLTNEERAQKSKAIMDKLIHQSDFQNAEVLFCYVDYRNEVETKDIIRYAFMCSKKVAVPKVEGDVMRFYEIHSFSDLTEGFRGILEPINSCNICNDKALVIVPGAAFDKNFHRIGYGRGYYDKYLSSHPYNKAIALAYACQILDKIPYDEFDIQPDMIITEDYIYDKQITE